MQKHFTLAVDDKRTGGTLQRHDACRQMFARQIVEGDDEVVDQIVG